jgi:hypothetical protein
VFAGAGRFNGGVEREEVGLLGKIIDDLNDLSDFVGAMAEDVDNIG